MLNESLKKEVSVFPCKGVYQTGKEVTVTISLDRYKRRQIGCHFLVGDNGKCKKGSFFDNLRDSTDLLQRCPHKNPS